MISAEDCEFIKKFEVANSEEKQVILTNEGHQVWTLLCYLCIIVCLVNVLVQHMLQQFSFRFLLRLFST